jgi:DNA (cytosine-5)-methyltransferase 1
VGITKELPTVISFCSGYGGIERGLDLAGLEHRVIAYVEIEAFAIANLVNKMEAGQLPPAPIYTNLKTFPAHLFRDRVDLITGGYPCQPFSAAGQRKGADDPRHLWPYIRRHIEAIRPARCFFENVEGHISLGLSTVISDLEEDGYRATWGIFSAREVGAPHQRKRVYILADTSGEGSQGSQWLGKARKEGISRGLTPECSDQLADTICSRSETGIPGQERYNKERDARVSINCGGEHGRWQIGMPWPPEPRLGRVVDGCADRVDRIRMLGNGVVPQTAAKAYLTLKVRGLK